MNRKKSILIILTMAFTATIYAGPKFNFNEGKSSLEMNTALQWWGAYTPDPQYEPETKSRADFYLRRGQFGLKGQAMPSWLFQTTFAFDNAGKDPFGGTSHGSGQDLSVSRIIVQEATTTWEIDSNLAVLTMGLFRPQTSREFTGSYASVSSLDYSLTYAYVRQHLLTRSSGRETGVDLGGQWAKPDLFGVQWHIGGFDAYQEKAKTGADLRGHRIWSPMVTGRFALTAGQMENAKQSMKSSIQYFGKRTGVTIGVSGTYQGENSELWDTTKTTNASGASVTKLSYAGGFLSNQSFGTDLLANWKGLALNGEASWLSRKVFAFPDSGKLDYTDFVWHVRAAYAFKMGDSLGWIEPNIMYSSFQGDEMSIQNPDGEETQFDVGINYYPETKGIRYSIHYVRPDGEMKSQYTSGPSKDGVLNVKNSTVVAEISLSL